MIRKILGMLVIVPLAIIFIAFAVVNRHLVTVSFDLFNFSAPNSSTSGLNLTLPLFVVIILAAMLGVVAGGIATWVGQWRRRRTLRRVEMAKTRGSAPILSKMQSGQPAALLSPNMPP
jgi:uncharacterized metal-binding protein